MTDTITIHEQQGFSTSRIQPTSILASTFKIDKKMDNNIEPRRKPNYTLRRLKFAAAIIGFVSSVTLLFTWHVTDRHMAWLVAGIYILTGLWLTVRFAPRD